MNACFKLFRILFFVFLIAFMVGGVALVGLQAIGLFATSGEIVTGAKSHLAPWVFGAATLCAICAFVLGYRPEARAARRAQKEREEQIKHHESD